MREIRFRAWDNIKKEMVEVDELRYFPDDENNLKLEHIWFTFNNSLTRQMRKPDEVELLEFTGLKDRDGKEIYEGDIIENRLGTGLVEWKDNGFWMKLIKCEDEEDKQFHWDFSMEGPNKIIGNIYQNGDLLK